ncbi:MAG: aldehyde ferredoxin oxidoreductase N-terminal domain-containing protein [Thermoleophilia bacterium]
MTDLYGGKILRVDLTRGEVATVPTERYAPKFIGGRGFNARLLYEAVDASTDPLGPENIVGLSAGPLSGTLYPGCSRTDVMCKSPVTGYIGNASMGGDWSAELKHAGWDAVVLEGKAAKPVYVAIRNDRVEIRDAGELWGKQNYVVQDLIRSELGSPDAKIVSIGPAGENQVVYSTIHCNVGNAAARTGTGAVMGSKNCKAIACAARRGSRSPTPRRSWRRAWRLTRRSATPSTTRRSTPSA